MITSRFSTWTFVVCLLLSLVLCIHLLFGYITPVIMAMVIASIFYPTYQKLFTFCRGRDYLAAGISTALVVLCVLIPLSLFLFALVQQGIALFHATEELTSSSDISTWMASLQGYIETLNEYLARLGISISSGRILTMLEHVSQAIGQWIYKGIGFLATNLVTVGINFFLTVALVFVFFVSGPKMKEFIMELAPLQDKEKEQLAKRFKELSSAIVVGNGLISILEGLLGGLSFLIFGISGALIWGVVMTVAAFLPVVGATIVVIPAALYLFLLGQTWQAILFLIFNIAQLSILEAMVKPKLIGTRSQMHAVLVFLSVLAGIQTYGFFGLLYGPLLVTAFLSLAEIYKENYRDRLMRS